MTEAPPSKPRRRWLSFSLRFVLLVPVAVIAVPLAWKVNRVQNQRAVVAEVRRLDGRIVYDYQLALFNRTGILSEKQPSGMAWLRSLLGDDFFAEVADVYVNGDQVSDRTLFQIATLPHLESLIICSNSISDDGLKCLAGHGEVESLGLISSSVTGQGLTHLSGLKALKHLSLRLSSSHLECIAVLTNVNSLALHEMPAIMDEDLKRIATLDNLRHLSVVDVPITDDGLLHLYGMLKLQTLILGETQAGMEGVRKLRIALPNCTIQWNP